jgi:hypothetical protein
MALVLVKSSRERRRLLFFAAVWWVTLTVLSKGDLSHPGGSIYTGDNAQLQNFVWLSLLLAAGVDAVYTRWWFRRQTPARLAVDVLAAMAVLCWLRPVRYTPEVLARSFFPVATADDVRGLKRLGRALKGKPRGILAVPAAMKGNYQLATGAGGWAKLYLPNGWESNSAPFYHIGLLTLEETRSHAEVSRLLRSAPPEGAPADAWLAELRALRVEAVFWANGKRCGFMETTRRRLRQSSRWFI